MSSEMLEEMVRRLRSRPEGHESRHRRRAAVAMVLRQGPEDSAELLFILRAHNERDRWSGQVAFPGGRKEAADADDRATAIRETKEELGLDLASDAFEYIARLDDREVLRMKSTKSLAVSVHVFVQRAEHTPPITRAEREVADYIWVDVRRLLDPRAARWGSVKYGLFGGLYHVAYPALVLDRDDDEENKDKDDSGGQETVDGAAAVEDQVGVDLGPAAPKYLLWGLSLGMCADFGVLIGHPWLRKQVNKRSVVAWRLTRLYFRSTSAIDSAKRRLRSLL